ncbi:protein hairy-like [Vespa mandarinia]|uniref:protein hairy-like n=1 Tax=Vespa mandarinia TaxID=7446 RepID=UPI00161337B3|nr:protein hairy-like [Vespa mandarinia]XP_046832655.1 protein hairy-like [Vespa crabro]XP_047362568.1 protein hairy-like [Vespa velutina]
MVTGVGATMPTGGVTVGATPPTQHVPQEAGQPPAQTATTTTTTRRSGENRRSNKPIMEKRRRARINNCLNDLKTLILDAMKKDPARHSKLEKADILEMTVKHLETLQRQQVALAAATDPNVLNKFRAGFTECAGEVGRFPGLDASVKRRLMAHLASCLGPVETSNNPGQTTTTTTTTSTTTTANQQPVQPAPPTTQLQVHILPQVDTTPRIQVQQSNGIFFTNANGTGLQLVPTRLPNGDIALVLPAGAKATPVTSPSSSPAPSSPLPTLIPIPQRTASTASASSSSSSSVGSTSTSAASPVAFEAPPAAFREQQPPTNVYVTGNSHRDVATSPANGYTSDPEFDPRVYSPPLQKPLALVMRKSVMPELEDKPWRPW